MCFDIWKDEVDVLYILINGQTTPDVNKYILSLLKKYPTEKVIYLFIDHLIDHGPALDTMLDMCTEDYVMLVEEDGFIFKKGQVDKCFNLIEDDKTDIVASARGSCMPEVYNKAEKVWGTPAQTPNFWPNFLFIKKDNLLQTDRHFHAKNWNKGDYIKELDLTITDEVSPADTFVWVSMQLRAMGLRVTLVEQYHSYISDVQDVNQKKGLFDGICSWLHIGSLSGWQHCLMSDSLPPLLGETEEWERRVAAWLLFWEDAQEDLPSYLKDFSDKYKRGIDRMITEGELSLPRIKERVNLFRSLINPELYGKKLIEANRV